MRQIEFERRHQDDWQRLAEWLEAREAPRRRRDASPLPPAIDMPALYRSVCSHLALARERRYGPELVERLHQLVLRGHHQLYAAPPPSQEGFWQFLSGGFAREVRREWRVVSLAGLLFFGPLLVLIAAIQVFPDFASVVIGPQELAQFQSMYDPEQERLGQREGSTNFEMFAMYVWNNTRIGFQTFAGGVLFGLGTLFFLLFNGLYIGTVLGHLHQVGLGPQIWSFVAGHSALELVAIVISGAAGLKLGAALIAPGRRSRRLALVEDGRCALRLMGGAAVMFFAAAVVEGFWSPLVLEVREIKYGVGIVLWLLVLAYFLAAGRAARVSEGGDEA